MTNDIIMGKQQTEIDLEQNLHTMKLNCCVDQVRALPYQNRGEEKFCIPFLLIFKIIIN